MSVDAYPYAEWTQWPEEDVREWVQELASTFHLETYEANALLDEMLSRSGRWRQPPRRARYPVKMDEEAEASYVAAYIEWYACRIETEVPQSSIDLEVFEQNRRLNQPARQPAFAPLEWERERVVGSGLSSRSYWKPKQAGPMSREIRRAEIKTRKLMSKHPLRAVARDMVPAMEEWLWRAGCLRLAPDRWMVPQAQEAERDGLWWYYEAVRLRLEMANRQIKAGEAERAAWHSLHAGRLYAEMEMKAAHDQFFKKTQRTRDAQSAVGRASEKVSRELRRDTWWKYRRMGYMAVEAGFQAGEELGVSERTIRRAFDDEYPKGEI